jgi:hypothetical protein
MIAVHASFDDAMRFEHSEAIWQQVRADGHQGRLYVGEALTVARQRGADLEYELAALARYLVVIIQGLSIEGKVRPTPAALDGVIDLALHPLHWAPRPKRKDPRWISATP